MVFNPSQQLLSWILGLLVIWLVTLSFLIFRAIRHYNRLSQGISHSTLKEVLEKVLKDVNNSQKWIDKVDKREEKAEKESLGHIQRVGLLRFNPFDDVGGDQSFVLALLNGENDGIILTALHSRTGTRWYGKTVKKGQGVEHELSNEEKEAIKKAEKKE